jgi:pimeloyl-ACP methyl ester carboxylesterase
MEALFFSGQAGPLFGLLTPAEGAPPSGVTMVVCPPFGQEGLIAHNALRQLAVLAARDGIDVFRFDYSGSGDSAGADETFTLAQAQQDVLAAAREAADLTGARRVVLVGMRLGGVLAIRAAAQLPSAAGVMLWDPLVAGQDCVSEMTANTARLSPLRDGEAVLPGSATFGYDGFPITPELFAEFEAIDLLNEVSTVSQPVFLVHSADPACARLAGSLPAGRVGQADSRRLWTESPGADSPPVSTEAIRRIIGWCRTELG